MQYEFEKKKKIYNNQIIKKYLKNNYKMKNYHFHFKNI